MADDEELTDPEYVSGDAGSKCSIFLIDGNSKMLDSEGCPFRKALQLVRNLMVNICCVGESNEFVAVIVVNTREQRQSHNTDHVFVWQELDLLNAERVREIDAVLRRDDLKASFIELCGGHGKCDFGEVFWLCNRFATHGARYFQKKDIFLLTNDENPFGTNQRHRDNAIKNAEDLRNRGVRIHILYLASENQIVDLTTWKDFDEDVGQSCNIEELENEVRRKKFARRPIASIPFRLSDDVEFSVELYYLVVRHPKPKAVLIESETNEKVVRKTEHLNRETGEKVLPSDLQKISSIGGEKIVMERDEMESIRRISPPGIVLLGFKSLDCFKLTHHMKPAHYLFPREKTTTGSNQLYWALFERCLKRNQMIIARYTQKKNTSPRLVALIPLSGVSPKNSENDEIDGNDAFRYEGFHLHILPFAEDKRNLTEKMVYPEEEGQWPVASTEQVDAAAAFVKKLTRPYCPDNYTNPVLQQHYTVLQALALDEQVPEEIEDLIHKAKAERGRTELNVLKNLVFPLDYVPGGSKKKTTVRRTATDEGDGTLAKKGRILVKEENVDLRALVEENKLHTLTVAELRGHGQIMGIPLKSSMKKDEIVKKITERILSS